MGHPVTYRVSMPNPHSHLFEVEAEFPSTSLSDLTVCLPVWTPGSYLVREYARHVQDFEVTSDDGTRLPFTRVDKRSFRIDTKGTRVRCRYRVYANELTVRTSHLDDSHGYFNGATLFFYSEQLRLRPHRVQIDAPPSWRVTTTLRRDQQGFLAADYDELVDSPFEIGPTKPIEFLAGGRAHELALWGDLQLDEKRLVSDLTRIIETEAALFDGVPNDRYIFFLFGTDKGRGGLEHKASTALLYPRTGLSTPRGWEDFLTLCAHEYLHLWNVKRVKPKRFVPFDYSQENYTQLLWFFEGGTSYYDSLITRRAGCLSPSRYLTRLGETLTQVQATPGRRIMSLTEASMVAWTKHYRPDENTANTAVSYYAKGEIVCALLDLTIRRATSSRRSLDDVLRLLWKRFGDESGVPENGVEAAATEVAGVDLGPFFERALRSTEDLELSVFETVGLVAKSRTRESAADKGGTPPRRAERKDEGWLGITARGTAVATVLVDSPAMEAGLYADDEVCALDRHKCDAATLVSRCEEKKPGDVVKVSLFRRERLLEVPVTLGTKPLDTFWLARVDRPTESQRAAYEAWLRASWDEVDPRGLDAASTR